MSSEFTAIASMISNIPSRLYRYRNTTSHHIPHQEIHVIVGTIFLCINTLILSPIILFGAYTFYKYMKTNLLIMKRKPYIVIISCISAATHISICATLAILILIGVLPYTMPLILFWRMIGHIFSILPQHLSVLRFWCLYYEMVWYKSIHNDQWQSVLNPALNTLNWFILNKKTWGNIHWLKYRFSAVSICLMVCCETLIVTATTKHYRDQSLAGVYSLFFIIPMPFIVYIYCKLPELDDCLLIRREMVLLTFISITHHICIALRASLHGLLCKDGIYWLITEEIYSLCAFGFAVTQCMYIIYKARKSSTLSTFKLPGLLSHQHFAELDSDFDDFEDYHILQEATLTMSQYDTTERAMANTITLSDTLKHSKGYELFMNHISNEHSSEALLSLTEFNQFKQRMIKEYFIPKYDSMTYEHLYQDLYHLSEYIPQSMIVYNDEMVDVLDGLKMYRKIVYLLWDKYIRIGAEFEINISYHARNAFHRRMNDKEFWIKGRNRLFDDEFKLFHIFDECQMVCYSYCSHSFQRFKSKLQFQQLLYPLC